MNQTVKEQMLERWRASVENDREVIAIWREHKFCFKTNGVDTTEAELAGFQERIDRLEALIKRVEASDA